VFRAAHYEMKPLLRAMFLSDAFWAAGNRGSLVKAPVDVVVGTLRTFEIRPADLRPAAVTCAFLGQDLFGPPNVKGWPGGDAWIDSATLLGRRQFVDRVFRAPAGARMPAVREASMRVGDARAEEGGRGGHLRRLMARGMGDYSFDGARWMRTLGAAPDARIDRLVLATAPVDALTARVGTAERVRGLVADAAYQLK
jgi:hypothetical protein